MRACLYARVSSRPQAEEGKVSIPEQVREMEQYCRSQGYEVVARYQDVASGSTKRRDGFQEMLRRTSGGEFDVIVAWKTDRLARGLFPSAALMEAIEGTDVRVECVRDTVDLNMFGVMAAVSKIELDNIRQRTILGKRGNARKGKIVSGRVPYGYRVGPDKYPEADPCEGPVVQRIFRQYAHQGSGVTEIARALEAEGVPTRTIARYGWSTEYLQRLLGDQVYIGHGWYGKTRQTRTEKGRRVVNLPPEERIAIPFPPLLDDETFRLAQARKARTKAVGNHRQVHLDFLLRGMLYCEACAYRFIPRQYYSSARVRKSGKVYRWRYPEPLRYYECFGTFRRGLECRRPRRYRADMLEQAVWAKVRELLEHPGLVAQAIQARSLELAETGTLDELERAKGKLREVEAEEYRAVNLCVKGIITEDALRGQLKLIRERQEHWRSEVQRLEESSRDAQAALDRLADFEHSALRIAARLDHLNFAERRTVLEAMIDRVSIDGQGAITISFALGSQLQKIASNKAPVTL